MKKGHGAMLAMLLCCIVPSACRRGQQHRIIAVIEGTGGTGYWTHFTHAVRQRLERYGYSAEWSDPQSPAGYEVQARLLTDAIQNHVDGIILAPSHQLVLAEGVRRAHAAGIPVVIVDAPVAVQPAEYVTAISCSDEAIGFMAAQRFARVGGDALRILVVGASPTLQKTTDRETALQHALQRFSPKSQVAAVRYSLSDWARARQTTLDALAADPQINAIFASDDFSTHGVLNALHSVRSQRKLTVVSVDGDGDALEAVRTGLVSMTVACDGTTIGELAVDAMHDAFDHKTPEKLIQTPVLAITRDNIDSPEARRMTQ